MNNVAVNTQLGGHLLAMQVSGVMRCNVPAVSRFFGIVIAMYYDDHIPAHFHVRYAEHRAKIAIDTLDLTDSELPRRALALVLE